MDKKKILLIVLAIVSGGVLLFVYNKFMLPETVKGKGSQHTDNYLKKREWTGFSPYRTDHDYLYALLKRKRRIGGQF